MSRSSLLRASKAKCAVACLSLLLGCSSSAPSFFQSSVSGAPGTDGGTGPQSAKGGAGAEASATGGAGAEASATGDAPGRDSAGGSSSGGSMPNAAGSLGSQDGSGGSSVSDPSATASAGAPDGAGGASGASSLGAGGTDGSMASAQGGASGGRGPCLAPRILDDAEDRNSAICRVDGHVGNWWTTNDGTSGNQQPKPGSTVTPQRVIDRAGSSYAMHTSGSGFTAWGATLGFDVRGAPDLPYDASRFEALSFYAKGPVNGTIRVSLRVSAVTPTTYGGTCVESSGSCYHYHGIELSITDAWQPYRIPFADLVRENDWEGAFDPTRVLAVEFRINNPACTQDFSLWIDDVGFELP